MKEEAARPPQGGTVRPGQTVKPGGCATFASYRCCALGLAGIKVNQTESNQIKPAGRFACPKIGHAGGARGRRNAAWSSLIKPGQSQSNRVKASQTQLNPVKPSQPSQTQSTQSNPVNPVKPSQPSQTQSNPVKPSQTQSTQSNPVNPVKPSQPSQTQSNPVKPVKPVKPGQTQSKLRDSQESEQIMDGPLCGLLAPRERSNRIKPNQTESNRIKPNQACGAVCVSRNWTRSWRKRSAECSLVKANQIRANPIKPDQSQSNPIAPKTVTYDRLARAALT
jgi:hypothetical protein